MKNAVVRRAVAMLLALVVIGIAGAASGQPAPPAACTLPDAPPSVVSAPPPIVPELARHFGIGGRVAVAVTLDASGVLTDAAILTSPAPVFDPPALAAARAAQFAPGRKACAPAGGRFAFVVEFVPDGPTPPLHADPLTFFPGTWRCVSGSQVSLETFVREPGADRLIHEALPAPRESLQEDAAHLWRLEEAGGRTATGYPWVDAVWHFAGAGRAIDYEKIDDRTFVRTTTVGIPDGIRTSVRCTKTT